MTISESLKRFRNDFRLTQKDVASKIGIAQQAYYRYEADKNIPSAEIIISIANAYDVSTDYLLGRCDDPRGIMIANFVEPLNIPSDRKDVGSRVGEIDRDLSTDAGRGARDCKIFAVEVEMYFTQFQSLRRILYSSNR